MPKPEEHQRHIGARFTLEEAARIEAIAARLQRERPECRVSLSDALRHAVHVASASVIGSAPVEALRSQEITHP